MKRTGSIKRITAYIMVAAFAFTMTPAVASASGETQAAESLAADIAGAYRSASVLEDWEAIALASYDRLKSNAPSSAYANYSIAKNAANINGNTNFKSFTDYSRMLIAITMQGMNGSAALSGGGYTDAYGNSLNTLLGALAFHNRGATVNGYAYALIALDCGGYNVPENSEYTREKLISKILGELASDTSGGLNIGNLGVDMAAICIQALAPYCARADVKSEVDRLINVLSTAQKPDGSFASGASDATAETTAQVVIALASVGINANTDARFIKNQSAIRALLDFGIISAHGFEHIKGKGYDYIATRQGLIALSSFLAVDSRGAAYNVYASGNYSAIQLSPNNDISSLSVNADGKAYQAAISGTSINAVIPASADLSRVTLTLKHKGANIDPPYGSQIDLSSLKYINVYAENGSAKTYALTVTKQDILPKSISFISKVNYIKPKQYLSLKTKITPSNATKLKLQWKSTDTKIATVNQSGKVLGKKMGTVKIRATSAVNRKVYRDFTLYVYKSALTKMPSKIKRGEIYLLKPYVKNATGIKTFVSSKTKVLSTTADGIVIAKTKGKSKLIVKIQYKSGGKKAYKTFVYTVTVI